MPRHNSVFFSSFKPSFLTPRESRKNWTHQNVPKTLFSSPSSFFQRYSSAFIYVALNSFVTQHPYFSNQRNFCLEGLVVTSQAAIIFHLCETTTNFVPFFCFFHNKIHHDIPSSYKISGRMESF